MATTTARSVGAPIDRVEGRAKVTGHARYAFEHLPDGVAYAAIVQAPVGKGRVRGIDGSAALARPGVLAVIDHATAPRLHPVDDGELAVLQSDAIAYRGQIVAVVVADTLEGAREAAELVRVDAEAEPHDVALRPDHPGLYAPEKVNAGKATDSLIGDAEAALARAAVTVDVTYRTPAYHNNPLEPHASVAIWEDTGDLVVHDSNQGASAHARTIAEVFGLPAERVRVLSPHVGGGFGSKGLPRPTVIVAVMAAQVVGRPVKLAATRQQMFAFTGYRTPTIQRVRLGAGADGTLAAIAHEVLEQSSTVREFAEQTADATRVMYAAPDRTTTHRLVRLDVPTPSWMRAPGECPGMFALESAMDELAIAAGIDPIELRIRNEPETEPETGRAWSSRNLVACLREGAERFGWAGRDPAPGVRRDGPWLVGTGVAASTYPAYRSAARAAAHLDAHGGYTVRIAAADIGTGARTVLTQIAADALGVAPERVTVKLGDSAMPRAGVAGGSSGTSSWGSAVHDACVALRERVAAHAGPVPHDGLEAAADTAEAVKSRADLARHAFGAQFCEARVNPLTGEVRIARLLGVFAVGAVINPKTARSQLIGGMTMGLSMALHEESIMDLEFGDYLNHDLAGYHIAACADVRDVEAVWVAEHDPHLNPMGSKGIGEIGIVGTAAAVAKAVHHACGVRVRDLPIRVDRIIG
jgi:xanthine dehydrogenase YagR molybdenum-binding subunit